MTQKPYIERVVGSETYQRWSQITAYKDRVDMASSLLFFHIVNGTNEVLAGNDWDEVLLKRSVGTVLNIATYKYLNRYMDWMRGKLDPEKTEGARKLAADAIATETFGTVAYGLVQFGISFAYQLAKPGADIDLSEAWKTTKRFAVYVCPAGIPYGIVRDGFRRFFGVSEPAQPAELYEQDV